MSTPSPGMDPYLEHPAFWPDFHNRLITAISDVMIPLVSPKYYIAKERRKLAEEITRGSNKSVEDLYRELLAKDFEETYLESLEASGIIRVSVEERSGNVTTRTEFFSTTEVNHGEKDSERFPFSFNFQNFEYELVRRILKLARKTKPRVVYFDGRKGEKSDLAELIGALGELLEMEEFTFQKGDSIGDVQKRSKKEISCLIVAQPHEPGPRQVYELSKAVSEGIPAIFLVSRYTLDISPLGRSESSPIRTLRPGLDELFQSWGISLGKRSLPRRSAQPWLFRRGGKEFLLRSTPPIPFQLS